MSSPPTELVPASAPPRHWHTCTVEEALDALSSRPSGLHHEEAAERLQRDGRNELVAGRRIGPLRMLWGQLTSVMTMILIGAAALSLVLGKVLEASVIGAIVVLFAVLGVVQEHRAERAIAALARLAVPTARVVRSGTITEVSAAELVAGDVVLLEAGNVVPADLRVSESVALRVQESALTGESEPVDKVATSVGEDAALADRVNLAFAGTQVTAGRGRGVVVATGMRTELGRIADLLQSVTHGVTPLQRRLDQVGKQLALAGVGVAVLVMILGALSGEPPSELVLAAISVAVAVIPEGLPAVVTFTLAIGAQRMLRRQALVRKLPAVETLGSVTVICSDKTGTLTQNRMAVTAIDAAGAALTVDAGAPLPSLTSAHRLTLAAAALCNDAEPTVDAAGAAVVVGDPTEVALVDAAQRAGIDVGCLRHELPRVGELAFDSVRKRMSTVHALGWAPRATTAETAPDGGARALLHDGWPSADAFVFVKGATEAVLERTRSSLGASGVAAFGAAERADVLERAATMAAQGLRVLAVALRPLASAHELPALTEGASDAERAEQELLLLGLVGMIDPPRPEARAAVLRCQAAGIRTVMITGDHPLTASSIAADLGFRDARPALTGADLDRLDDAALAEAVATTNVFARVSPEHKLRLVSSLQRHGDVVAMTGDGVNDAPALRKADVGVAMGITGTEVSKEAADIVLRDDNFATIVAAVEEGRVIYDNLRRFVKFAVAGNIGKIAVMLAWPIPFLITGTSLDHAVALLPLQLLWLNLMTDGLLGMSLGFEPAERSVMSRPPSDTGASLWAGGLARQTAWNGVLIGAAALTVGYAYERSGHEHWQTVLFSTLAFLQVFQALATRSFTESLHKIGVRTNPVLLGVVGLVAGLQLAALYTPLRSLLDLEPLAAKDLAVSIGTGAALFVVLESAKAFRRGGATGLHAPLSWLRWVAAKGRRLAVLVVGLALVGAGLAMLVLPGPGVLVVIAGLAVLASEFAWAERILDRTKAKAGQAASAVTVSRGNRLLLAASAIALLTGGALVLTLVDGHRVGGASAVVAGACSLAVLLPRVQRWLSDTDR